MTRKSIGAMPEEPVRQADDDKDPDAKDDAIKTDTLPSKIVAFIDGKSMTLLMTLLTILSLWGDDFRLCLFSKGADPWFYALFIFALVMFTGEFMLNTIAKEDYKWSFFFNLDFVAAISILPDVKWIYEFFDVIVTGTSSSASGSQSVATSVESARTARIVRLVRLIRLIRIVKLYSMFRKVKDADSEEKFRSQALAAQNAKQAALKRVEASRLGKVLSEMTTRRVVIMVLVMLLVRPYLQFAEEDVGKLYGLSQLFWYGRSACKDGKNDENFSCEFQETSNWISAAGWRNMVYLYSEVMKNREIVGSERTQDLLWLYVPDAEKGGRLGSIPNITSDFGTWRQHDECSTFDISPDCRFRTDEMEFVVFQPIECGDRIDLPGCRSVTVYARFELTKRSKSEAQYRMINTLFVCVLLASMSIQFQNDTQTLVIAPIEKMVNIIKQLAEDPLKKPDLGTFNEEDDAPATSDKKKGKKKNQGPQLETTMLENTILKIGGLLQVGFGEAGAQIIGKNMSSGDGELNIMMPGTKIMGIFGFVDIRQFTDTTECLKEEVMVFVNAIGCILHTCVHRWSGVANKNIGDAFLLLWKLPENTAADGRGGSGSGDNLAMQYAELANRALLSFIKMLMECRRSSLISSYSTHPKIIARFGDNYKVRFGLALHTGWAIEGPIGSDYKVDASYLSPHVNVVMTLEEKTKLYGTVVLMSEKFYNMLSIRAKDKIRKIDVAMLQGSIQGLYTFMTNDEIYVCPKDHKIGEIIKSEFLEIDPIELEGDGAEYFFVVDQDIAKAQEGLPVECYVCFREALCYYVDGDWETAKIHCEKAFEIDKNDGPTHALYNLIKSHDFQAPSEWPGHRTF